MVCSYTGGQLIGVTVMYIKSLELKYIIVYSESRFMVGMAGSPFGKAKTKQPNPSHGNMGWELGIRDLLTRALEFFYLNERLNCWSLLSLSRKINSYSTWTWPVINWRSTFQTLNYVILLLYLLDSHIQVYKYACMFNVFMTW